MLADGKNCVGAGDGLGVSVAGMTVSGTAAEVGGASCGARSTPFVQDTSASNNSTAPKVRRMPDLAWGEK